MGAWEKWERIDGNEKWKDDVRRVVRGVKDGKTGSGGCGC